MVCEHICLIDCWLNQDALSRFRQGVSVLRDSYAHAFFVFVLDPRTCCAPSDGLRSNYYSPLCVNDDSFVESYLITDFQICSRIMKVSWYHHLTHQV